MKKYAFEYSGSQTFSGPVTRHDFLLRCIPVTCAFQRSYAHKLTVTPYTALSRIMDVHGNAMYSGTVDKRHTSFTFRSSGFVLCSKYMLHEPLDRLYLYPTALTRPIVQMAKVLESAPLSEDPWNRALQLCDLTHRSLKLTPRTSGERRTAAEVLASGHGDARDQAHVLLALLRSEGIPARFVNGFAVGTDTVHCWVEVCCGDLWRALDPTTGEQALEGYLKVSQGPDYTSCALERGCFQESDVTTRNELSVKVTQHVITARDTSPHKAP